MKIWRAILGAALAAALLTAGSAPAAADVARGGTVPVPKVIGPVTGGERGLPYNPIPERLAERYDYLEEEFFLRGEATAYAPRGELGPDGAWTAAPSGTAPFQTRILVRRPKDSDEFNGIVLVEWLNVTAGRDSDPDFGFLYPELLKRGYAYVGVSAQQVGVEGGGAVLEVPGVPRVALIPLKEWDPERYAPLDHPGDEYSYDIFSQAARVVRKPPRNDPLGGLDPEYVIAAGESQSAGRMVTYVNAVHPVARVFDGFLIHSRGDGSAELGADDASAPPDQVATRADLAEPVLQFETETDLLGLGFLAARQPDSDSVATWEVAGTAHADQATIDYGTASAREWYDGPGVDFTQLCGQLNTGPQAPVLRAALKALRDWVVDDTAPPDSPDIEVANDDIVVDELGNARGGIRTPAVDAPIATLTGKGNPSSVFCSLFGQTTPFSPEQLAGLYPSHRDYVERVTDSADAAVVDGFLLPADRNAIVKEAKAAPVPS